jgi:hypothetical protein
MEFGRGNQQISKGHPLKSQLSTKGDKKIVRLYSRIAQKGKSQGNCSFAPPSNEKFLAKGHYT